MYGTTKRRRRLAPKRRPRFRQKPFSGPRVYSLTRLTSTNYQQNYGIGLISSATGYPQFISLTTPAYTSDVLSFVFTLSGVQVFVGGQGTLAAAPTFTAPIPGATDFSNLFDSYFIEKIEIRAYASYSDNSTTGGTIVSQLPYVLHAPDHDDAAGTTAVNLMQRTGAKYEQFVNQGNGKLLRVLRPSQAIQMYNSSTTTGYAPRRGYCDMANPNIPHYGYKLALDNANAAYNAATNIGTINFTFRYFMKFKYTI